LCVSVPLWFVSPAAAADWPQWRGPDRSNRSKETGLLQELPPIGPKLVWLFKEAGVGFSGPAIVGGRIYLVGATEGIEYVFALDDKGTQLWKTKIGPTYTFQGNEWNEGPLATPSVDDGRVYAFGSQGELVCVDAAKGTELWRKDMAKDFGGEVNPVGGGPENRGWGYAWSPLVDGDQVLCVPGGKQGLLAALNKKDGSLIWQSKDVPEQATYSSPIVIEVGGVRQYVQVTQNSVVGVSAKDGSLLWAHRREEPYPDVVIPTPLARDNLVLASAWGGGVDLLKITPDGTKFKA